MKRRSLLFGSIIGAAGLAWWAKPKDQGANHSPFFKQLSAALDDAERSGPSLVVDIDRLSANINTLMSHINGRFHYRIVAKSLPSLPLLEQVMRESGSRRLMLFHQPFINQAAKAFPDSDILLGKPMPAAAARNFYQQLDAPTFDASKQLRWLLDTPQRLRDYGELAQTLNQPMQICIELDVGLHRGGVHDDDTLIEMLNLISASEQLQFCGFMGYEPHVVKVPGDAAKYRDKAMALYRHYVELAKNHLGEGWPRDAVLNAGGSPTYQMYDSGDYPFNELAAGSCLVKPTDFDLPTLADHQPASWIATPVLKVLDGVEIPGINIGVLQSLWDPNRAQSFFTYGGYWKAQPESPKGLKTNAVFGRSTNQEMLNGSRSIDLQADDWVFLRPTQSEFVFLQFGDIAVYKNGAVVAQWPVFKQSV